VAELGEEGRAADDDRIAFVVDEIRRRFFDPRAIEWAGSEVAVASPSGQPRRIDRLVLLGAPERCWWVLDYKLSSAPQDDPTLLAQLADYRQAIAALVPGEPVRAAFITAAGELIEPAT